MLLRLALLTAFSLLALDARGAAQTAPGRPIEPPAFEAQPGESDAALCARTAAEGNFRACTRAVRADRDDLESRRNLALAYLAINDLENTDRVHREIIALTPDDPRAYYDFAAALTTFFEFKHAVEPMRAALRLAPDDRDIIRLAAMVFEQAKEYRDAFAVMKHGAELGEMLLMFDVAVYYQRGLGTLNDPQAAREWFERAAEAGHVGAMEVMAAYYRDGRDGTPRDGARARYWAERARAEGIPAEPPPTKPQ